jgi:hypothetical protein
MKSKYDVILVEHEEDFFWCLYEKDTEQAINFFLFKDDAEEQKNFLEKGGAFNGFTPTFMLKEVNLPKTSVEINKNFEELLE